MRLAVTKAEAGSDRCPSITAPADFDELLKHAEAEAAATRSTGNFDEDAGPSAEIEAHGEEGGLSAEARAARTRKRLEEAQRLMQQLGGAGSGGALSRAAPAPVMAVIQEEVSVCKCRFQAYLKEAVSPVATSR